ncbi:MAG: uncharacterized protein H6Q52_1932 [Deltaproteobacteria bacterium]|nr:uncharacterized protein [Deltaproteobacteria bacterium]
MENTIEIIFNGMKEKVESGTTVADLILQAGENDKGLIVEQNNRFVHPRTYQSTTVKEGDKIELINPDFGG